MSHSRQSHMAIEILAVLSSNSKNLRRYKCSHLHKSLAFGGEYIAPVVYSTFSKKRKAWQAYNWGLPAG